MVSDNGSNDIESFSRENELTWSRASPISSGKTYHKSKQNMVKQSGIPDDILENDALNASISQLLPKNYDFEIHKTIHVIRSNNVKRVALQLPEGLQMYASQLAVILQEFAYKIDENSQQDDFGVVILADVTYGACCVDDFTAKALGCDLLVHYGHSCLVPITKTSIRTLYVFVSIQYSVTHLIDTILLNFPDKTSKLILMGTIQFSGSLSSILTHLRDENGYENIEIPQIKPLSPGEVLGCTSPKVKGSEKDGTTVIYIGDGRFHLESMMIANPDLASRFFRYDPYEAKLTHEFYDYQTMLKLRRDAIEKARLPTTKRFGLLVGTLGRQGNLDVVNWIAKKLTETDKKFVVILLSEISKQKLNLFDAEDSTNDMSKIDAFIQTSCPRLSIDWGYLYDKPLLTPYEAMLTLLPEDEYQSKKPAWMKLEDKPTNSAVDCGKGNASCYCQYEDTWDNYPMDFYGNDSLGPWTPNHMDQKKQEINRQERRKRLMEKLRKKKLAS